MQAEALFYCVLEDFLWLGSSIGIKVVAECGVRSRPSEAAKTGVALTQVAPIVWSPRKANLSNKFAEIVTPVDILVHEVVKPHPTYAGTSVRR